MQNLIQCVKAICQTADFNTTKHLFMGELAIRHLPYIML